MPSESSQKLQALFDRRQAGVKFSLDAIRRLCEALGNPHRDLAFIHIAGTNGKGSVAAMCAAILQQAGLATGLYTSPHLVRYQERFRMNGSDISDTDLGPLLDRVLPLGGDATFFEISTALAFCWFQQRKADVVVLETGLGGRLDATNIVTPRVAVITAIGMDHMQFLGNGLTEIAREKAGIIKPGVPLVTFRQAPPILETLLAQANALGAPATVIDASGLDEFPSPLGGDHQRWNTALAVAAARRFQPSLSRETIEQGLSRTRWPGRCQLIERPAPLPPVLVDGAHNPLGAQALAQEVMRRWGTGHVTLIFGALADKDIAGLSSPLAPLAAEILLTPVASERSASAGGIGAVLPGGRQTDSLEAALREADRAGHPIVIAGSLFLAGEALQLLLGQKEIERHPNERFSRQ
jgi:dihydrofolate synthase/folylpolyglutamate synthase